MTPLTAELPGIVFLFCLLWSFQFSVLLMGFQIACCGLLLHFDSLRFAFSRQRVFVAYRGAGRKREHSSRSARTLLPICSIPVS